MSLLPAFLCHAFSSYEDPSGVISSSFLKFLFERYDQFYCHFEDFISRPTSVIPVFSWIYLFLFRILDFPTQQRLISDGRYVCTSFALSVTLHPMRYEFSFHPRVFASHKHCFLIAFHLYLLSLVSRYYLP